MKKFVALFAIATMVVSCGNKNSTQVDSPEQKSAFLLEQPKIEGDIEEILVDSVGEANAAQFYLKKDGNIPEYYVKIRPGNDVIVSPVKPTGSLSEVEFEGKWKIADDQYNLIAYVSEEDSISIIIPQSLDKAEIDGEEEYKLFELELIKIAKIEEKSVKEDIAKDFITKMYNKSQFEDVGFLKTHCSPKLLQKLSEAYDYDGEEGYASWLFRSDNQDGPNDKHEIIQIEPEGNNWYKYEFYDMGTKGSRRIKLLLRANGNITIDDIE